MKVVLKKLFGMRNILRFGKGGVNNMAGYDGPTALHLAAIEGKEMIVDFLLCKMRKTRDRMVEYTYRRCHPLKLY